MSTAVTASVWGQGLAAMRLSAQAVSVGMREGDEECHICRDDIPATIAFLPCRHKVCFGCMENMRAKNIFKADKGIKCPFCRRYVDGYDSTRPATDELRRFLSEANKAANTAAAARQASERKASGGGGQQGPAAARQQAAANNAAGGASSSSSSSSGGAAVGGDQLWNCGGCGERNYFWRELCGRCKRPGLTQYGSDKLSQTRKDLGSITREELVTYLHEQGGFCLRRGLRDMGLALDSCRTIGSVACVREATAAFGLKKRVLHLADLLADPDTLQAAALHHLGNLGVQRCLEAFGKLRAAFGPGSGQPQHPEVQEFIEAHNGLDPFGAVLAALNACMLPLCLHDKGVYVVQCAANNASNRELVDMANAAFAVALPVSRDPRGIFVLLSLLELFSSRIWEDAEICEPALQAVDTLCNQFSASDKQLVHTGMHALSGKVLVKAIALSMPRFPALRLAIKTAAAAAALAPTSGGQFTLTELLSLYGHNQEAAEGLRDVVTVMCFSLQGQVARFATSSDVALHELLLCLVERLGHEQETAWLDSVVQELVGVLDALAAGGPHSTGLEIFKFALTQPCLDLETITAHVADMKGLLPPHQLQVVVSDLMARVATNPPPPAPKYPAASAIQPQLRYLLAQGYPTPLPPPPPPREGDDGYAEWAAAAGQRAEEQALAAAEARAARDAAAASRRKAAAAGGGSGGAAGGSGGAPSGAAGGAAAGVAAAAAAAAGSAARTGAVMDAWSSLRTGSNAGGSGTSNNSAWDMTPASSAAQPANDAWGATTPSSATAAAAGGGGGPAPMPAPPSSSPWGTVAAAAAPAPSNAWGGASATTAAAAAAPPHSNGVAAAHGVLPSSALSGAPQGRLPVTVMSVAAPPAGYSVPVMTVPVVIPVAAAPAGAAGAPMPVAHAMQQQQQATAGGGGSGWPVATAHATPMSAGVVPAGSWAGGRPPQQQHQQPPTWQQQAMQQHQQQLQQQAAAPQSGSWHCTVCTYEHTGPEAEFLACSICGAARKTT